MSKGVDGFHGFVVAPQSFQLLQTLVQVAVVVNIIERIGTPVVPIWQIVESDGRFPPICVSRCLFEIVGQAILISLGSEIIVELLAALSARPSQRIRSASTWNHACSISATAKINVKKAALHVLEAGGGGIVLAAYMSETVAE